MTQYLARHCPSCGSDRPIAEVRSDPKAEALPLDKVAPYWSGLFKEKVFFSYDRCGDCGLLYAPTYFKAEQLGELYAAMAPNMDLVPDRSLEETQAGYWAAAKVAGAIHGGYLEIGPDIGYIVRRAVDEGAFDHFWLFEPNVAVHAQLTSAASSAAHTISAAMDDLSEVPDGSIGLAVMVHVLDHVLEPTATLERVRAKLRPDGLLIIVTHNERSLLRKLMGLRWPPFCLQHPEIYNPASITGLLRKSGYTDVQVKGSKNVFPLPFMAQQAAYAVGINLKKVPLPNIPIGLKLGNMITLARP